MLQSRSATVPQVCSALHQQYAEFGVEAVRAFAGAMAAAPQNDTSLARRRTALRVLAQLLLAGVSEEWSLLIEVMLRHCKVSFISAAARCRPCSCCWQASATSGRCWST